MPQHLIRVEIGLWASAARGAPFGTLRYKSPKKTAPCASYTRFSGAIYNPGGQRWGLGPATFEASRVRTASHPRGA